MRISSIFKAGSLCVAIGWALSASNAMAGGIPELEPPDVFSGDFGIELAKDRADGESVLDGIEGIAGPEFPWDGGFAFPATLPTPASRPPAGGLGEGGSGGGSGGGAPVPEPSPAILMALGLAAFGFSRRPRTR